MNERTMINYERSKESLNLHEAMHSFLSRKVTEMHHRFVK